MTDRLQAGDLKSYLALAAPTNFTDGPSLIPKTDEVELAQLQAMGNQGLGYELHDDAELRDTLGEFGIESGQFPETFGSQREG